jgi:hypothetical protein
LFFAQTASSRSDCDTKSPLDRPLPLDVEYIVNIKSDLTSLASTNGTSVAKYGDLVTLVKDIKTQKRSAEPFRVTGMELTMACLRETVLKVHNYGALKPVDAPASGKVFVKVRIQFVGLVKQVFIVVEMTSVHAHSDNSHKLVRGTSSTSGTTPTPPTVFLRRSVEI